MQYFQLRDFEKSVQLAFQRGGQGQNAAKKVKAILGNLAEEDPFHGIVTLTHNGESRIAHCRKYDLGGGWRLVTRQHDRTCGFLFMGSHDDVDRWLDEHRGMEFAAEGGHAVLIPGVGAPIATGNGRRAGQQPLIDLLPADLADQLMDEIPRSLARRIEALDGSATREAVEALCAQVADAERSGLLATILSLLLAGNVDGAISTVKLYIGAIRSFDEIDESSLLQVQDGPHIRRLRIGSKEYEEWLAAFEKRATWHEWFLFLHPDQERVVMEEYPGPAQLSGVSGSGKTCVAVRRAIRFASAPENRVLLVTLNRSLSGLLSQLVDAIGTDDDVKQRIEVTSFFELAQRLLRRFEPGNEKLYLDVTWKLNEHVDEVFREYYRRWLNCHDAEVLLPLHMSVNARGVNGEVYLREEFDWIRSAVGPAERTAYRKIERIGRRFPIMENRRDDILKGLEGWENKMRFVGVIDYLGLTTALSRHLEAIRPEYTHIIVDEAQDFGTTELRILRRLVPEGPNDLFLCGDVAQTILPKHRSLADAGIPTLTRARIVQNYRNSREILRAAYAILVKEINEDILDSKDLEILDPRFANFSGPLPLALCAETLEEEIAYARSYAATRLAMDERSTVCIAFAGFSARDVEVYAEKCGVRALDGAYSPQMDRLVFSDLEQTKGYEFDVLIIVQCTSTVLPPRDAPEEEKHRAACKLYVAMTRAKRELILSFHGAASAWITAVSDCLHTDLWSEFEALDPQYRNGVPTLLPEVDPNQDVRDVLRLTGTDFLYSAQAIGLSLEAQQKLVELVTGRGAVKGGTSEKIRWENVGSLIEDLTKSRMYDRKVGPAVARELRALGARMKGRRPAVAAG
jgi:hypothetical protein